MYKGMYSQEQSGLEVRKMKKPKGRSCGYYMRIIFLFSSLVQSLIIASLVLFLVYGQSNESVAEKRVQELELNFGKVSMDNINLKSQRDNLTDDLNKTRTEKKANEKLLVNAQKTLEYLQTAMSKCTGEKGIQSIPRIVQVQPPTLPVNPLSDYSKELQSRLKQQEQINKLNELNFTQTASRLNTDLQEAVMEKTRLQKSVDKLTRDKAELEEQLSVYVKKCQEDFISSLQGIDSVTKAFLKRIDTFFTQNTFLISCNTQQQYLEQIRANCTSLSTEVENKFQQYLNEVGRKVTEIQGTSSKLTVKNSVLSEDLHRCRQNHDTMVSEKSRQLQQALEKHRKEIQEIQDQKNLLASEHELQKQQLNVKDTDITVLADKIKALNNSLNACNAKVFQPPVPKIPTISRNSLIAGPAMAPGQGTGTQKIPESGTKPVIGQHSPDTNAKIQKLLKELQTFLPKDSGVFQ